MIDVSAIFLELPMCVVLTLMWPRPSSEQVRSLPPPLLPLIGNPCHFDQKFSCLTANARPDYFISAWTFYLVAMLFDSLALSISTVYLLKKKPNALPQSK